MDSWGCRTGISIFELGYTKKLACIFYCKASLSCSYYWSSEKNVLIHSFVPLTGKSAFFLNQIESRNRFVPTHDARFRPQPTSAKAAKKAFAYPLNRTALNRLGSIPLHLFPGVTNLILIMGQYAHRLSYPPWKGFSESVAVVCFLFFTTVSLYPFLVKWLIYNPW